MSELIEPFQAVEESEEHFQLRRADYHKKLRESKKDTNNPARTPLEMFANVWKQDD